MLVLVGFLIGACCVMFSIIGCVAYQALKLSREKVRTRQHELDMLMRDFISQEDCEMVRNVKEELPRTWTV